MEIKSYNLSAILMIALCNAIFIFFEIMFWLTNQGDAFAYLSMLSLIIVFSIIQVLVYIFTIKKVVIDYDGIHILNKTQKTLIEWDKIKQYFFYSFLLILEPNTLEIIYNNGKEDVVLLGNPRSSIHISSKKYKESLKFIPKEISQQNKYFFYPTDFLLEQDKYNIYTKNRSV